MRVALNGYFWNQPRTGSGQYLRHLWSALQALPDRSSPSATGDALDLLMLLPPEGPGDDPVPTGHRATIVRASSNPLSVRSHNLSKLLWEQWTVVQQAHLHHVD